MLTVSRQGEAPAGTRRSWPLFPTAAKLVAILALLLLPLGVVAAMASARATSEARAQRIQLIRSRAQESAASLARSLEATRTALSAAIADASATSCPALQRRLRSSGVSGAFEFRTVEGARCSSGMLRPSTDRAPRAFALQPGSRSVLVSTSSGQASATAAVSAAELERSLPPQLVPIDLSVTQGAGRLPLRSGYDQSLLQSTTQIDAPIAGTPLSVRVRANSNPASAAEILSVLLPLILWLAASIVSWLVADRLLLRPIVRLRDGVLSWRPGQDLRMPKLHTPATEIRELADAFTSIINTVAARERDIEAGAGRQKLLVREVHHRVKNNLQVVSSLLNLHARGARTPEAAAAYAAILRRVDALAVVHRNHFAELEENRGVALRTLLSELSANLRGNAAPGAERMGIAIDADPVHATQDVAVSVAFLITEIVEYAMLCAPETTVEVSIRSQPDPTRARLSLRSDQLRDGIGCGEVDARQFDRVTVGLARQLRSTLERDLENGEYAVVIPVLKEDGASAV